MSGRSILLMWSFFIISSVLSATPSDSGSWVIIRAIYIIGNEKTHPSIIQRELTFVVGDSILKSESENIFKISENHLLNTDLFSSVSILMDHNQAVYILLKEQHYIWPIPILKTADRNFNQWLLTKDPARLEYGTHILWNNLLGRNDPLKILLTHGFTQQIAVSYARPFWGKQKKWGLGVEAYYKQNREVWAYPQNDKLYFFRDQNQIMISKKGAKSFLTYRHGYYDHSLLGISIHRFIVADTVVSPSINIHFLDSAQTQLNIYSIHLSHSYDKRDQRAYAFNGYLIKVQLHAHSYHSALRQRLNIQFLGKFDFYKQIKPRWLFSNGTQCGVSRLGQPPYEHFHALGYENRFVRGYEYNVIDGTAFIVNRSNSKFIVKKGNKQFKEAPKAFKSMDWKLMLGPFVDWGYVSSTFTFIDNKLPNSFLYGYGLGLDFVVYYNRIVRTEFTINREGQAGIFIHFLAPL